MLTSPQAIAVLEAALKGAAEAHHRYEEETGVPDANWAHWYAEHMENALAGSAIHLSGARTLTAEQNERERARLRGLIFNRPNGQ
jgi:hypothetical protein